MSVVPVPQHATPDALPAYPTEPDEDSTSSISTTGRRRWPWVLLTLLGMILAPAPLFGGMFYPAAQGKAMIGEFAPYTTPERLAGLRADLARLADVRTATARIDTTLRTAPGTYPQVEQFRRRYPGIDADMTAMITQIDGARPDFDRLSELQPLDVIPFIPLGFGLLLAASGLWGWRRAHTGVRPIGAVVVGSVAALALIAVPISTSMVSNVGAADPLLARFDPILTTQKVRDVQGYFVVLVGAVGELDSRYVDDARSAPVDPARRQAIDADLTVISGLSANWQPMSSEFAGLIGTMNDNIDNSHGVDRLNSRTESLGFGTFAALPWALIGAGSVAVALVGASLAESFRDRKRAR